MSNRSIQFLIIWVVLAVISSVLFAQVDWEKHPNNPVLGIGAPGSWEDGAVFTPAVLFVDNEYKMWYSANDGNKIRIGHATSPDGITWSKADSVNPVLDVGAPGSWDDLAIYPSSVIFDGNFYHMWYSGYTTDFTIQIGYATSPDGIHWSKADSINPILRPGASGSWDEDSVFEPSVIFNGNIYQMWYTGLSDFNILDIKIGYAVSNDGLQWTKADTLNPVLSGGNPGSWDERGVGYQFVRFDLSNNEYQMWFFGQESNVARGNIGFATSPDGINWDKAEDANPVLKKGNSGEWDERYVVYPSVLKEGNTYKMWYSGRGTSSSDKIGYATATPPQQGLVFTKITDSPITSTDQWGQSPSWADYDNDGDQDLLIANGAGGIPDHVINLFENNGDGTFNKIQNIPLVTDTSWYYGSAWGDYDNDGDLDIFLGNGVDLNNNNEENRLYRNDGNGVFTKITGIEPVTDPGFVRGVSWVDADGDGNLDIFVVRLDRENSLYKGDGAGNFTKVTGTSLVTIVNTSLCAAWSDFDRDGDMDMALGYVGGIHLYENQGNDDWTASALFNVFADGFISLAWGDYDNDGWMDLFAANLEGGGAFSSNVLFKNNGDGTLTRVTTGAIATEVVHSSVSSVWADFDNDGDLDLLATDGIDGHNFVYVNDGSGNFTRDTTSVLAQNCGGPASAADYDNDGDIDIVTAGLPNNCVAFIGILYRNDTHNGNNWLKIRLHGTQANAAGIGTKLHVKASINGHPVWQMREITQQTGIGHNSLIAHFGLGDAAVVDSLVIEWPGFGADTYTNVSPSTFYEAVEDSGLFPIVFVGVEQVSEIVPEAIELFQNYPNPFNPTTEIRYRLDKIADVNLSIFNNLGQKVRTLVSQRQSAGEWSVQWDGTDDSGAKVSSGIYYYRLKTAGQALTRKMLLLK